MPKKRKSYLISCSVPTMERVRVLSRNTKEPVSRLADEAFSLLLRRYARREGIDIMIEPEEKRETKHVIMVANHKGGVGKTTTTAALAYLFATKGHKRVCLLDADTQANLTLQMNLPQEGRANIKAALQSRRSMLTDEMVAKLRAAGKSLDIPIAPFIVPTKYENIDMIPGNLTIGGSKFTRDLEDVRLEDGANPWKEVIDAIKAMQKYDIIIIDTHPSIGIDTTFPMQACDEVLVPTQAVETSLAGLFQVYNSIQRRRRTNPNLRFLGCFFNMVKLNANSAKDYVPDARKIITAEIQRMSNGEDTGRVFNTVIRDSEDAKKATNFHCPVTERFSHKNIAKDFEKLYDEIVEVLDNE